MLHATCLARARSGLRKCLFFVAPMKFFSAKRCPLLSNGSLISGVNSPPIKDTMLARCMLSHRVVIFSSTICNNVSERPLRPALALAAKLLKVENRIKIQNTDNGQLSRNPIPRCLFYWWSVNHPGGSHLSHSVRNWRLTSQRIGLDRTPKS